MLGTVCGNQANVALMQHRHEQALALAERSVELQEQAGTPHGLAIALASLGQICVRLGSLKRAEEALNRALDVRSPQQFMRETTGARVRLAGADRPDPRRARRGEPTAWQRAREAYGETRASRWYQWSVRVLDARVALRRGDPDARSHCAPRCRRDRTPRRCTRSRLSSSAVEALLALGRTVDAQTRLDAIEQRIEPGAMSGTWGEFLRLRGRLHAPRRPRDRGVPRLRAERQRVRAARRAISGGLGALELGRLAAAAGARSRATRLSRRTRDGSSKAWARRPSGPRPKPSLPRSPPRGPGGFVGVQLGRRRRARAAIGGRVGHAGAAGARRRRQRSSKPATRPRPPLWWPFPAGRFRVLAAAGCDADARAHARSAGAAPCAQERHDRCQRAVGRDVEGPRYAVISLSRPLSAPARQRFRTLCAVCGRDSICVRRASGRRSCPPGRSNDSSSRCCPVSSARARRCSASRTRFSACRGTT